MKLSLRELFLLVALVAMGCGWWVEHRQSNARHAADLKEQEHWARFLVETLDQKGVAVKRMSSGFLAQPKYPSPFPMPLPADK